MSGQFYFFCLWSFIEWPIYNPEMSIHTNNEPLHKVTISKYLGMFIDSNLKWDDHINNMIPKIFAKIGIRRSLRNIVPNDTPIQIYKAIVQTHLDYGDAVYDSTSQTSKNRLQKLQTRSARLIMGSGPHTRRNLMFNKLKWLSLQQRQDFHKCILVYVCMLYVFIFFIVVGKSIYINISVI